MYVSPTRAPLEHTSKTGSVLRIVSFVLPEEATPFSDGAAGVSRSCPLRWGRCPVLSRWETC